MRPPARGHGDIGAVLPVITADLSKAAAVARMFRLGSCYLARAINSFQFA